MESLKSRLEALLEKDMMANYPRISESPLLTADLDMFTIDTPAKLKNICPALPKCPPLRGGSHKPQHVYGALPSKPFQPPKVAQNKPPLPPHIAYPAPRQPSQVSNDNTRNFGYFFSDPTPLKLVSDSPLVTPLKFLN